jgi:hypothetical protein
MSGSDVFDKQSYMRALVMSTRGIVEAIPVTPFADWNYYYTNANIITTTYTGFNLAHARLRIIFLKL